VIDGVSTRVVGVMPEGFGFPVMQDAWMPLATRPTAARRPGSELVSVFARLTSTATQAQAAAEATALLRAGMIARDSTASAVAQYAVAVESFPVAQMGEERTLVFTFLNLLSALILLLALVNVTTLLTARANERVRETAVRLALGAPRSRLVMQGMWEGTILCVLAGVLGTAVLRWRDRLDSDRTQLGVTAGDVLRGHAERQLHRERAQWRRRIVEHQPALRQCQDIGTDPIRDPRRPQLLVNRKAHDIFIEPPHAREVAREDDGVVELADRGER
jgi:hypothetical protein